MLNSIFLLLTYFLSADSYVCAYVLHDVDGFIFIMVVVLRKRCLSTEVYVLRFSHCSSIY